MFITFSLSLSILTRKFRKSSRKSERQSLGLVAAATEGMTTRNGGAAHMRVGSLNVCSMRACRDLARAVQRAGPFDVLALQEAPAHTRQADRAQLLFAAAPAASTSKIEDFASALGMRVATTLEAAHCLANVLLVADGIGVEVLDGARLCTANEDRTCVCARLPDGSVFACTHLCAESEEVRVQQWGMIREAIGRHGDRVFVLGDFNALRKDDYTGAQWQGLVASRARVHISSETALTALIERDFWDCRAVAAHVEGPVETSHYGARVDYVWASGAALAAWTPTRVAHVPLFGPEQRNHGGGNASSDNSPRSTTERASSEGISSEVSMRERYSGAITDHNLVVCDLERRPRT